MKKVILNIAAIFILSCAFQTAGNFQFDSFYKPRENPILSADSSYTFFCPIKKEIVHWQKANVFNPAAIIKDNKVFLLYRCEDNPDATLGGRTSRIGLAESSDGIHFKKYSTPVLYPDEEKFRQYDYPGGCEDPRIVQTEDGLYILTYTSWNEKTARLSIASSNDLFHWQKHGPAFEKAYGGKYLDTWSKSGSIITKMENNRQIIAKINGKYWMYWGEHFINLAWSDNLIDWFPVEGKTGKLKTILSPRAKKFDSGFPECGPPALITEKGIMLIYNGKNAMDGNTDMSLPKGTYSAGKAIFDVHDPEKLISQSDTCFLKPSLPHETSGQYSAGTTFVEGMVYFKGKYFLYYGTADSYVGVAVSNDVK